jgi:sodium transport system permease protein
VAFVLTPPLAMGFLLTSNPRRTLRLYWPRPRYVALGAGLALALNPLVNELRLVVETLFPISEFVKSTLGEMVINVSSPWTALVLLALVPAVCEEFAFRGYILSGLERAYRPRTAILFSALLFGFLHVLLSLFQQLFNATLLGIVLGLLAWRSGSLLPGIVFHFVNNGVAVLRAFPLAHLVGKPAAAAIERLNLSSWLYRNPGQGLYHWPWIVAGGAIAALLIVGLVRTGKPAARSATASGGEAGP